MGKITNVLNKIQKSREVYPDQKIPLSEISYTNGELKVYSKKMGMLMAAIFIAGSTGAIFMSVEIHDLKKSVKMEEKRFNDLTGFLSNNKNLSDDQIEDFNFRLKNEAQDRRIQINKLALIDNVYYINFVKSIHANTLRINYLEKYTESLKTQLDKILVLESQIKDLPHPSSPN